MEIVRSILTHPSIFKHIHDDNSKECDPLDHPGLFWMLVEDDKPAGVFLVHAHNSICYEVHTSLLPRIWGEQAKDAAKLLLKWAFSETDCLKMITRVPAYNKLALKFAKTSGMEEEGINRASFLKNGELVDQIMLGITRKDWLCQQQSQS